MLKIFQKVFIFLTLLCHIPVVCFAEITDEELLNNSKKMEKIIHEGMRKIKIPGAVFSVARGNKVIYSQAIGKTTIDSNSPKAIDSATLFPVSSVTKNVTAILVGALVDEGILSFEDKVKKYVPDFFVCNEKLSNEFNILDLISHRSGFKHYSADTLFKGGYDNDKVLASFKYLKHDLGKYRKHYGYQNIIYGIVGKVIENATGEKYEDLVQKYIFDKMDIKSSSAIRLAAEASKFGYFKYLLSRFDHDKKKLGFFKAALNLIILPLKHKSKQGVVGHSRYIEDIVPLEEIGFFHKFPATAGISFSAEDFAKWLAMLANKGTFNGKQIVSEKTFEKLTSNITEIKNIKDDDVTFVKTRYSRKGMYYGIGFFKSNYFDNGKNAHEIFYHMGGIYSATAFFAIASKDNIAVGVICNVGGVAQTLFPQYMVHQFLDMCFGFSEIDWTQEDITRKEKFRKKQHEFHRSLAEKNPTPMGKCEKYVGTYTSEIYGDVKIFEKNGKLYVSNDIKTAELKHVNGDAFCFPSKDLMFAFFDENEYISFFKDDYGNINSFYITCLDENNTIFKKTAR
jgi:CubicO group peptidase (beta-lactamase class C family)